MCDAREWRSTPVSERPCTDQRPCPPARAPTFSPALTHSTTPLPPLHPNSPSLRLPWQTMSADQLDALFNRRVMLEPLRRELFDVLEHVAQGELAGVPLEDLRARMDELEQGIRDAPFDAQTAGGAERWRSIIRTLEREIRHLERVSWFA